MNSIKYLKYLIKHKYFVAKECFRHGLYWRGLVHDLSKLNPIEFLAYRNYFCNEYPTFESYCTYAKENHLMHCYENSKEGVAQAFDYAWLHHQHNNKHHWQHWLLREDDGAIKVLDMPYKYIQEMVCDWIGAGLAITGKREANVWYQNNKDKMQLSPYTRGQAEALLEEYL